MSDPSEIVEFLRARLGDDESAAKAWMPFGNPDAAARAHIASHDPGRVLREVEAKHSIVDAYVKWSAEPQAQIAGYKDGFAAGLLAAVEALAAAYSEHPEYRPGWRL